MIKRRWLVVLNSDVTLRNIHQTSAGAGEHTCFANRPSFAMEGALSDWSRRDVVFPELISVHGILVLVVENPKSHRCVKVMTTDTGALTAGNWILRLFWLSFSRESMLIRIFESIVVKLAWFLKEMKYRRLLEEDHSFSYYLVQKSYQTSDHHAFLDRRIDLW